MQEKKKTSRSKDAKFALRKKTTKKTTKIFTIALSDQVIILYANMYSSCTKLYITLILLLLLLLLLMLLFYIFIIHFVVSLENLFFVWTFTTCYLFFLFNFIFFLFFLLWETIKIANT